MTDLGPNRKRIAQLLRMLCETTGERRSAFAALERLMQSERFDWKDIANEVERDEAKYTETEMQQYAQAARAEGVETGIKIGLARASNGASNGAGGHLTLPKPVDMAAYCRERLAQMKDDAQRKFVSDVHLITRRGMRLSPGRLGYLASIYIQIGGKV
jgi:hypothetical protein